MSTPASSRALAILSACAVIFGSLTLASPAMAEADKTSSSSPAPEATPEATPETTEPPADESAPGPEPSETSTPTPAPTTQTPTTETPTPEPSATSASPEFVNYTGRITRLSEDDAEATLTESVHLFRVIGLGYLRVDTSRVDLGSSLFDQVTLRFAVPAGLDLSADQGEAFTQLALASTSVAPLVAVERVVAKSRQRNAVGTDSLINKTPASTAVHKIYAVLVTPAGGPASPSANQTAAKVQTSVSHADDYWAQQSGGVVHFQLAGTTSWYQSTYSCTTDAGSTALWNEAFATAAAQLGAEDALNTHLALFFPTGTDCGGGIGYGTVGYSVNSGGASWVVGTDAPVEQATLAHELGHNLSLGHASWLQCSSADPHPGFLGDNGCAHHPYGDYVDVMGFGTPDRDGGALSSPSAIRSGLWPSTAYAYAPLGTTTHTLNSVSSNTGKRSVIVEDVDGVNYFVEFRNFTGEDAQYLGGGCDAEECMAPGAGVRVLRMEQQIFSDCCYVYLFKGYPGDDSQLIGRTVGGLSKVDYTTGQSFNSQLGGSGGVTITVTGMTATTATVSVTKRSNALSGSYVTIDRTVGQDDEWRVGDTLTGFLEADWTADSIAFQWYRTNDAEVTTAIPGATGQSYVLTTADINRYISVKATGTVGAAWESWIDPDPFYYLGYGPIFGGIMDPGTVSIDASTSPFKAALQGWTTVGTVFAYQWTRNGANIAGATASSYTPTAADRGVPLGVTVKGSKAGYDTVTVSDSGDFTLYATGTLAISGTLKVGHTVGANSLAYSTIVESVPATVAYQWYRNGVAIAGATGQNYALVSADYNLPLTVKATASYPGTIAHSVTVAAVGSIVKGDIAGSLAAPVVAIDPSNLKLTASLPAGSVTEAGVASGYQWYRGAVAIPLATASAYTLTATDYGQLVAVKITLTKSNYNTVTLTSVATNYSIAAIGTPEVGGVLKVGKTLQPSVLDYTTASGPVSPNLAYQWYRTGIAIAGATSETYTLVSGDFGLGISVRVTASLPGYLPVAKTTPATTAIGKGDVQGSLAAPVVTKDPVTRILTAALPAGSVTELGVTNSYQWYRGAVAIPLATAVSYQLAAADAGLPIWMKWTVAKANFTSAVLSSAQVNHTVQTSDTPVIGGTLKVGESLGVSALSYVTVDGPVVAPTVTYQWLRNGLAIAGATGAVYALVSADFGTAISVKVTGASVGYLPVTKTSAATAAIGKGVIGGDYTVPIISKDPATLILSPALPGGSITEAGVTNSYQWFRGAVAIPLATASTYKLIATDYGQLISVRWTVSKSNYTSVVLVSAGTNHSVATGGTPSVTGLLQVGATLAAVPPSYTTASGPVVPPVVYQWYRSGIAIAGATGENYVLVSADYGTAISVKVTTNLSGYLQIAKTSANSAAIGKGVITGSYAPSYVTKVGLVLTANLAPGSITDLTAAYGFQWFRGAAAIAGATAPSYTLNPAADTNQLISVRITASKPNYHSVVLTSPQVNYTLTNPAPVSIAGAVAVGQQVTAAAGQYYLGWDEVTGDVTLSYQWFRAGVAIAGATSGQYLLAPADLGKAITVKVTAAYAGALSHIATSPATQPVGADFMVGWDALANAVVSENPATLMLTMSDTGITMSGVTNAYQWYRGAAPIVGATASTFQLTAADWGQNAWVRVTVTKPGYTTIVKTSVPANYSLTAAGGPITLGGVHVGETRYLDALPIYSTFDTVGVVLTSVAHQWLRAGVPIPGATSDTYVLDTADYGKSITLRTTATRFGFLPVSSTSNGSGPIGKGSILGTFDPPVVTKNAATMTLSATIPPGSVTEPGVTFAYQWFRGSTAIPLATSANYTLTAADYLKVIYLRVTVSKLNYNNAVYWSPGAEHSVFADGWPVITGDPRVGVPLLAVAPTYLVDAAPASPALAYQWLRNGVAIAGATAAGYTPVAADYNTKLSVRVTGAVTGYLSSITTSPPTATIQKGDIAGDLSIPQVTKDPATLILTSALPGASVTEPGVTKTYQWFRGAAAIVGATAPSYHLTAADYAQAVSVKWTISKLNYTTVVLASAVADYSLIPTSSVPVISPPLDGVEVGATLGIIPRDFSADGSEVTLASSYAYQWYRSGIAVVGPTGTGQTYLLTAADFGKAITVKMTVSYPGYLPSVSTSAATPVVGTFALGGWGAQVNADVSENPVTLQLTMSGTGITEPGVTNAYQWFRGAVAIPLATASTFQLAAADYGQNIWVRVTVSKPTFTTIVKASVPTNYSLNVTGTAFVSGTLKVGNLLTVSSFDYNTIADGSVSPTKAYQWLRNGAVIAGATGENHTLVSADYGTAISVRITGTYTGYLPGVRTTAATTLIAKGVIAGDYTVPTITQTPATLILTAALPGGSITEPGVTNGYQWYRGAAPIAGATAAAYTLTTADYGQNVSMKWTVSKLNYTSVVLASAATNYSVTTAGTPTISGVLKVGEQLTANPPAYTNSGSPISPTLAHQWYRNGIAIAGATGPNYTLVSADFGTGISAKVTASLAGYLPIAKTSTTTAMIGKGVIAGSYALPVVVHTLATSTLTATLPGGSVTEAGVTNSFQWYRSGVAIAAAIGANYVLVAADYGTSITVKWTVAKSNYTSIALVSAPTDYSVATTGTPSITGDERVGQTLHADAPAYTLLGVPAAPVLGYQWSRNGAAIAGAVSADYTLIAADYGKTITVKVVASATGYLSSTKISFGTAPIALGIIAGTFELPVVTEDPDDLLVAALPVGSVTEPGAVLTYQWYRAASPIPFATGSSYALTAADHGASMWVKVTATKANYSPVAMSSVPVVFFFGS